MGIAVPSHFGYQENATHSQGSPQPARDLRCSRFVMSSLGTIGMKWVLSAARNGARMALAGAAVAAGWNGAQAETWQKRLDALETGAPAKMDLGTPQLAQDSESEEPITLAPVTVEGQGESATGPVDGYVATQSTTGSKTDTPIIETPQSISVVTADQMDAQAAGSLGESFRYTPGITAEQWGTDMRGYGIKIRGFDANDNSFYRTALLTKCSPSRRPAP